MILPDGSTNQQLSDVVRSLRELSQTLNHYA